MNYSRYGKFIGTVKLEWIDDGDDDWARLLEDFQYVDPDGLEWVAPSGTETDGASIPWWAWAIVGNPMQGRYRRAAIIHDRYCETKARPWRDVHRVLYRAARCGGCGKLRAFIIWLAVMIGGPKWTTPAT